MTDTPVGHRRSSRPPPQGFLSAFDHVASAPESDEAWRVLRAVGDPPLRRLILKALGKAHSADADDCLQRVWQRLAVRLQRARGVSIPDLPWPYCCKIARNVVIDMAESRDRRPPAQDLVISPTDVRDPETPGGVAAFTVPTSESALIAEDVWEFLQRSLGARGWAYLADFLAGYTHAEICDKLGISQVAGRKLKERAVTQAQALLETLGYRPIWRDSPTKGRRPSR